MNLARWIGMHSSGEQDTAGAVAFVKCDAPPYFSHNSLIQHSVADMHLLYSGLLLLVKVEAQHIPC